MSLTDKTRTAIIEAFHGNRSLTSAHLAQRHGILPSQVRQVLYDAGLLSSPKDGGEQSRLEPIGDKIRRLRRERGWTQEELGILSGINPTTISFLERHIRPLLLHHLQDISRAFGMKPSELAQGTTYDYTPRKHPKRRTEGA